MTGVPFEQTCNFELFCCEDQARHRILSRSKFIMIDYPPIIDPEKHMTNNNVLAITNTFQFSLVIMHAIAAKY